MTDEDFVGRGGPCIEAGCTYVGMRKSCHECQYGGQHDERTRALLAEAALVGRVPTKVFCRCPQHAVEHAKEHHGIEPKELFCLRCKQSLGTWTNTTSPAGAPWCGGCRPWWHE